MNTVISEMKVDDNDGVGEGDGERGRWLRVRVGEGWRGCRKNEM